MARYSQVSVSPWKDPRASTLTSTKLYQPISRRIIVPPPAVFTHLGIIRISDSSEDEEDEDEEPRDSRGMLEVSEPPLAPIEPTAKGKPQKGKNRYELPIATPKAIKELEKEKEKEKEAPAKDKELSRKDPRKRTEHPRTVLYRHLSWMSSDVCPDRIRTVTLGSNFTVRIFCQVQFCRCKISGLELVFSVVDLDFRAEY